MVRPRALPDPDWLVDPVLGLTDPEMVTYRAADVISLDLLSSRFGSELPR